MGIAIITGASSGIGKEFAQQILYSFNDINEIWLIARRRERLTELAKTIKCKTRIIQADLTNPTDIRRIHRQLQLSSPKVKVLVNCAGYGTIGNFMEVSIKEQAGMVDINDKALVQMTYMVLPYMMKKGRIIQIASVAAFLPQPGFAVYAASKAFVLSFSRALNEELRKRQISVTAVCPGPVNTEFFDIAEKGRTTLQIKKYFMKEASDVVNGALVAAKARKSMYISTIPMKLLYLASKIVPTEFILKLLRLMK